MSWRVVMRPEVRVDLLDEAAAWYDGKRAGLGANLSRVARVLPESAVNPFLNSRRHHTKHIRWRFPERFPYRIIYRVDEAEKVVLIVAMLHTARQDHHWHERP